MLWPISGKNGVVDHCVYHITEWIEWIDLKYLQGGTVWYPAIICFVWVSFTTISSTTMHISYISTIIRYLYHLISTKLATSSAPNSSPVLLTSGERSSAPRPPDSPQGGRSQVPAPSSKYLRSEHGMDRLVLVSTSNRWFNGNFRILKYGLIYIWYSTSILGSWNSHWLVLVGWLGGWLAGWLAGWLLVLVLVDAGGNQWEPMGTRNTTSKKGHRWTQSASVAPGYGHRPHHANGSRGTFRMVLWYNWLVNWEDDRDQYEHVWWGGCFGRGVSMVTDMVFWLVTTMFPSRNAILWNTGWIRTGFTAHWW